jgi:transcriptional regulator with XRE-family HTH domain
LSETAKLINGLKSELKARGLTYKDLAGRLNLSEPSVKRLFAEESFTLERFAKACEVIGTSMRELMKAMDGQDRDAVQHLTLEQEEYLASDRVSFGVFHRLLKGDSLGSIKNQTRLSDAQMTKALVSLDKLGVIDLMPGNNIRLRTPRLIKWSNDGPLLKTYGEKIRSLYFKDPFIGQGQYFRFFTGPLSARVAVIIEDRLHRLSREIEDMWEWDMRSRKDESTMQHGILLASKPWIW